MRRFFKDPDAVLDYEIDWSVWLDTDTISTSNWTVESGLTEDSDTSTTTTSTVWLSGGTVGKTYTVTNRITTAAGRTADESFEMIIREK